MNYFRWKLSGPGADHQAQTLQLVKQAGGDGIQISDGLCLKVPFEKAKLESALKEKDLPAVLSAVDAKTTDLTPDEKLFIG
ncbi:MAG: hypothetical protein EOP11_15330 [Proteobacteria bacterium]|nr:MAG: hypothetical protein EOP11_15330 [Pseudomonadota bacterium]